MATTQPTPDDALARLGVRNLDEAAAPALVEALRQFVQPLTGDLAAAVNLNVEADVSGKTAKLVEAGIEVPEAHLAKLERDARADWAARLRTFQAEADAALAAVERELAARAERQRRPLSHADRTPASDRTASLVAALLDGQEQDRAERFVREASGEDVIAAYEGADDVRDAGLVRHVERLHAERRLRLRHDDPDAALGLSGRLAAAIEARREQRVRDDVRDALAVLPRLRADLARAAAVTTPGPRAAERVLAAAGKPGTGATRAEREAAEQARLDALAAARHAVARSKAEAAAKRLRG